MIRASTLALALLVSACTADESLTRYGAAGKTWVLTELNGAAFAARATIEFQAQDVVVGSAPCNRFSSRQTEPYPWFKLGPILSTKTACPDLDAETAFFSALDRMSLSEVGNTALILSNDGGESMIFREASSAAQ